MSLSKAQELDFEDAKSVLAAKKNIYLTKVALVADSDQRCWSHITIQSKD
jgi:hypothetical protein